MLAMVVEIVIGIIWLWDCNGDHWEDSGGCIDKSSGNNVSGDDGDPCGDFNENSDDDSFLTVNCVITNRD